jgi:subtilisin family serine protease
MKKRVSFLLLGLLFPLLLVAVLFRLVPAAQTAPPQDKFDDALRQALAESTATTPLRFIIHLTDQADLSEATLPASRPERTAEVVRRLQQTAAASQASLLAELQALQAAGQVATYQPLWIINSVVVSGTAAAAQTIANRPDSGRLTLDAQNQYLNLPDMAETATTGQSRWNIERIRASHTQSGLGLDGSNVTIGIMDSGVDWLHPDLMGSYRGYQGGNPNHSGNWFDAVNPGNSAPVDPFGHGTHVTGIAVGQNGFGVAPGAQWIAARAFDQYGIGFDSHIHSAFQWLLAPAGNPALAPDVVNHSWGGAPFVLAYVPDVAALRAAGIIQVFAAGNGGPGPGSISAPASYPGALAVGASDDINAITWFSSRGPSPLTNEIKPALVAPGSRLLSTWPDGQYRSLMGTSMAAPHVAGAAALLLSANPALTEPQFSQLITSTARPLSAQPNYGNGWGLLDVYAAAAALTPHGTIKGVISSNGLPLPGVAVTITTPEGVLLGYQTDPNGVYEAPLLPGSYDLYVAPYAYQPASRTAVVVSLNQVNSQNISLTPLPQSLVSGHVIEAGSGVALTGQVHVPGTPVSATINSTGDFSLHLPAGTYQLIVSAYAHRLGQATITVNPTTPIQQNFVLQPGPSVLLIDSGQWYYDSHLAYFRQALQDSNYAFDEWIIRDPFLQTPTAEALAPYEVVVWSAPYDAPGYIGADNALFNYLQNGGNLLISGQYVATFDYAWPSWWAEIFDGRLLGEAAPPLVVNGQPGSLFDGLALTLNGADSAANQSYPDQTDVVHGSLSQVVMRDGHGLGSAIQAGLCEGFRGMYLGFGLEGVDGAANRAELVGRSLAYFTSPPNPVGVRFRQDPIDDLALPGTTLVYTITLQNLSETLPDSFHLELEGASWPAELSASNLAFRPCDSREVVLTMNVPAGLPHDTVHNLNLRATSSLDPNFSIVLPIRHKTPGQILLIDDDRWYDQQPVFRAALDQMNVSYDVWDTNLRGSPSLDLLQAYDLLLWYTAYDWYEPITDPEMEMLQAYLAGGGRLFLNSQDYLYYHAQDALTSNYLGIAAYQESITPTAAYGTEDGAFSGRLGGPLPLDYDPYQNFSDGLVPAAGSQVALWHDQGMAAAVATTGENWRTLFWAVPFEKLPAASQATAMNQIVGWLSDLGSSSFEVDQRSAPAGATLAYTLTLRHLDTGYPNSVAITNTLPPALTLISDTLSGGASYNPLTRQITWQGTLDSGGEQIITYQATADPSLDDGSQLNNPVEIFYSRHRLTFSREAISWLAAPEFGRSTLTADMPVNSLGREVTYTLVLRNDGFNLTPTEPISAGISLPDALNPITSSLSSSSGTAELVPGRVHWQGNILPGQVVTITLALTGTLPADLYWLTATAVIEDGVTYPLVRESFVFLAPRRLYFPLIP